MIITICAAFVLAKIKHFRIALLFSTWTFYPILITQCFLILAQFSVFGGSYFLVQYASIIKSACLFVFIIPIIAFELYKPALAGAGFIVAGTVMNKFVMSQNGGMMPVYPTFSYSTGYVKPDTFQKAVDSIHILGNDAVKCKILTDYIDVGFSILSPGDLLIHLFTLIMLYQLIKAVNIKCHNNKQLTVGKC